MYTRVEAAHTCLLPFLHKYTFLTALLLGFLS